MTQGPQPAANYAAAGRVDTCASGPVVWQCTFDHEAPVNIARSRVFFRLGGRRGGGGLTDLIADHPRE